LHCFSKGLVVDGKMLELDPQIEIEGFVEALFTLIEMKEAR
jgi:hypothetical protein